MPKDKITWTESGLVIKEPAEAEPGRKPAGGRRPAAGRKGGEAQERDLDLNRKQSIEELSGNRIRKR